MKYKLLSLILIFILCLPILSLQAQDDVLTFDFERGIGASANFWQVYFTAPDGERIYEDGIDLPLIDVIDQARGTLDIAAFEWNNSALTQAVIDAHERGVRIRMVVDNEHTLEDDDTTIDDIIDLGTPVIDDDRSGLMHNKFMVIDGFTVVTGSMNFTLNGAYRNNNNLLIMQSRRLAEVYTAEFEEMFVDEEFGSSRSDIDGTSVEIDGIPVTVAFSPEDDVVPTLIDTLRQAEANIRFMTFSFTRDDVGLALLEMANQGVEIQGLFETTGSETRFSEMPLLYCNGLDVRQDGNPGILHHKVFIIDDHTVMTGSFNISNNATESNDENMIIIQDPVLVEQYIAEFDRLQAISREPDSIDCSEFEIVVVSPADDVEDGDEQVGDLDVCTDDILTRIVDSLDTVSIQIRDESEDLQLSIIQAQLILESYRARCQLGLIWNNENSTPGVTDPIQMRDGIYIVRLVSNQTLSIDITVLSGDCDETFAFVPSDGGEEEFVSEMEGCLMLMDIDVGRDEPVEWSVEFIPVILTDDN